MGDGICKGNMNKTGRHTNAKNGQRPTTQRTSQEKHHHNHPAGNSVTGQTEQAGNQFHWSLRGRFLGIIPIMKRTPFYNCHSPFCKKSHKMAPFLYQFSTFYPFLWHFQRAYTLSITFSPDLPLFRIQLYPYKTDPTPLFITYNGTSQFVPLLIDFSGQCPFG